MDRIVKLLIAQIGFIFLGVILAAISLFPDYGDGHC